MHTERLKYAEVSPSYPAVSICDRWEKGFGKTAEENTRALFERQRTPFVPPASKDSREVFTLLETLVADDKNLLHLAGKASADNGEAMLMTELHTFSRKKLVEALKWTLKNVPHLWDTVQRDLLVGDTVWTTSVLRNTLASQAVDNSAALALREPETVRADVRREVDLGKLGDLTV